MESFDKTFDVADLFEGTQEEIKGIQYTVYGDRTQSPCIAIPEVGLNHRTCFQSLFVVSGPQSLILKNFYTIFIDPPGCQPNATDTPNINHQEGYLTAMMDRIACVMENLNIKECLGLGVGNGAYLLAKYAAEHRKNPFFGLILLSPSSCKSSWWEWTSGKIAAFRLSKFGWSRAVTDHFLNRLFSPATTQYLGGDSDLMKSYAREIKTMNPQAVAQYLRAVLSREDIRPKLKQITCRILLVYGSQSIYMGESMELASHVDKSKFALVEVQHAGTLVNEERPSELLSPFQLFLTSLQLEGYGIGNSCVIGE